MGNCCCPNEENTKSSQVDKELNTDSAKDATYKKLLFLGSGGSGKSTIFKQLQTIHGSGFSDDDKMRFVTHIHTQVIDQMRIALEYIEQQQEDSRETETETEIETDENKSLVSNSFPLSDAGQNAAKIVNTLIETTKLTKEIADQIKILWSEPSIKKVYDLRAVSRVDDTCNYFWDNIDTLVDESYIPSYNDVLLVRFRTTGITEQKFSIKKTYFNVFDVGGQMSERKKWIHCFENVTAVIFVASLACYDKVMYEVDGENQMVDTLKLFNDILNNVWFRNTAFILFLNKRDLFEEKVKSTAIVTCPSFCKYTGPQTYQESCNYISESFLKLNQNKDKNIYSHVTCATDKDNVRKVFFDVQHIVVTLSLVQSGFTDFNEESISASPKNKAVVLPIHSESAQVQEQEQEQEQKQKRVAIDFRQCIKMGLQPQLSMVTYERVVDDYSFDVASNNRSANNKTSAKQSLFSPSYCYAAVKDEYFLSVDLKSNVKSENFRRKSLNLICLVDCSASMQSQFGADVDADADADDDTEAKAKIQVTKQVIMDILSKLGNKDRFGLITFENQAHTLNELQFLSEYNLDELKESIMNITPTGSAHFEQGFLSAIQCYDNLFNNDDDNKEDKYEYENRVLLFTDAQPTDSRNDNTLLDLVHRHGHQLPHIYTTFIGVGPQFDAGLVNTINKTRGSNYFSVNSGLEFVDIIQKFESIVTPIVFDVSLKIVPDKSAEIVKVYGTETSDNELLRIHTYFPETQQSQEGLILVKLKKTCEQDETEQKGQFDSVGFVVSYEDRDGNTFTNEQQIAFNVDLDQATTEGYYDNIGIRKAVALSKYMDVLTNWIKYEKVDAKNGKLTVSKSQKQVFGEILKYMQAETKICKDHSLQQEIDLLKILSL